LQDIGLGMLLESSHGETMNLGNNWQRTTSRRWWRFYMDKFRWNIPHF